MLRSPYLKLCIDIMSGVNKPKVTWTDADMSSLLQIALVKIIFEEFDGKKVTNRQVSWKYVEVNQVWDLLCYSLMPIMYMKYSHPIHPSQVNSGVARLCFSPSVTERSRLPIRDAYAPAKLQGRPHHTASYFYVDVDRMHAVVNDGVACLPVRANGRDSSEVKCFSCARSYWRLLE